MNDSDLVREVRRLRIAVAIGSGAIILSLPATLLQGLVMYQRIFDYKPSPYYSPEIVSFRESADELSAQKRYKGLEKRSLDQVAKDPNDAYGHYYLGIAYYYEGRYPEAIVSLKKAAQLAPGWEATSIEPFLKKAQEAMDEK